ncbi:molybdate transport repressor ModE-like protein [Nocardiopsis mwathae]|uniref:Molybdate transport repressor ModE-like protein n=1 Tax=Nocardiopsis mwathae TaxID=1472723 RepID=A0A7W9YKK9_9ACTN|nr:LysR family transcriptional regulator [Nocardiopsis mwathae]MBB6173907.1 molybdate transport repressor ModE-like protein [Nocardiopsis mwathae]
MLDIDRLRALSTIAQYGSVSAAAEVLGITTSAVSQQITKLERETSAQLLERNGRGVRLTDAAHVLVQHADRILELITEAEADLEAQRGGVVGPLRVAAFPTAARGLMPRVLVDTARRHPRLTVTLIECDPPASQSQVLRGESDLAVVQDRYGSPLPIPEGIERAHLFDDPAEVAMPAAHPLAGRADVELSELAGDPWISSPRGTLCYDWLADTLRRQGVEPRIAHYSDEYPTQLALVSAGLGLALLPRLGRGRPSPDVVTVPVRPVMVRSVYAVWRREAGRRPAVQAMLDALRTASDVVTDTVEVHAASRATPSAPEEA